MKIQISFILLITVMILSGCNTSPINHKRVAGYNFKSPDARVVLPYILHEISGINFVDSSTLVCIQDEKGILFFYDILRNEI
ncbi:MAG TPA: hypothetical protein DCZ51_01275, partial [Bacteroidales bacterium]|nr:hypothetical protein [Bacteroidales bacterium]